MRALLVHPGPDYSVADVHNGWVEGLRANGIDVAPFNLNDRLSFYGHAKLKKGSRYIPAFKGDDVVRMAANSLKAACYEWWPDIVIIVSGFFIPRDFYLLFHLRKHKIVILHTESPYEDDRQLEKASFADLNVLNDPTNIETFKDVAPTMYIPHAFDPERHYPQPSSPEYASDFCFVGTGYESRRRFFEQVDWTGINATLAGNWQATEEGSPLRKFLAHPVGECSPNDETVKLYASTKMSANVYRREAMRPELSSGWAMTPREVELAACGVFFARDPRGEGDEVLPMLPRFTGPQEFGDLVRFWLERDERRKELAHAARAAVADRTFEKHAALMLKELGV